MSCGAPGGAGIAAGPLREVGRVERRVRRRDDDLAAARNRVRPLLEPQLLAVDHDRAHRATVRDRA